MIRQLCVLYLIILHLLLLGCSKSSSRTEYIGLNNYSIRLMGNDHAVLKYGVVASGGLRIINDNTLESYKVYDFEIEIVRGDNVIKALKNEGQYFSQEFKTFMIANAKTGDVFKFKDVRAYYGEKHFLKKSRDVRFRDIPEDGSLILN